MGRKVRISKVTPQTTVVMPAERETLTHFYWFLAILVCGHFIGFAALSFLRFLTYKTNFDIAQCNEAFWSLLHTGVPIVTISPLYSNLNWFGAVHFSPIFYALVPFYALWPSPLLLQILHCACLSGAAIPVACALRRLELGDKTVLALVAMLLFNPFYFDAALWEFHEVSIGCLLIACGYWALIARHKAWFLLSMFLLIMTKEHFGLTVAGFGLLWWWRYRDGGFGFLVALAGMACMYLVLEVIMPGLNQGVGHFMLGDSNMGRYAWLKMDIALLVGLYLLFVPSPHGISGIAYLAVLFFTSELLPLLSPFYLLPALGDLATILLSGIFFPRSLGAYHSASVIPVLVIASGVTLVHYRQKITWRMPLWSMLVLLMIGINIVLFPKNSIMAYELTNPSPLVDFQVAHKVKSIIGDSTVSTQSNIGFLLSSGPAKLYPFPTNLEQAEYVVLYLRHPYRHPYYRVLGDIYNDDCRAQYKEVIDLLQNAPQWGIVLWEDNWLLLKKGVPDQLPVRQEALEQVYSLQEKGNIMPMSLWNPFLHY